jgi:hypothetical protein
MRAFFGGWSNNVTQWVEKADLVLRYEDLISDPQKVLERINTIYLCQPLTGTNCPLLNK